MYDRLDGCSHVSAHTAAVERTHLCRLAVYLIGAILVLLIASRVLIFAALVGERAVVGSLLALEALVGQGLLSLARLLAVGLGVGVAGWVLYELAFGSKKR